MKLVHWTALDLPGVHFSTKPGRVRKDSQSRSVDVLATARTARRLNAAEMILGHYEQWLVSHAISQSQAGGS